MTTFKKDFNNVLMDNLIEDLSSNTVSYYAFTSRYSEWADENLPDSTDISVQLSDLDIRKEMLFGKKITANNASKMIRKIEWSSNTVYDYYDHRDADLYTKDFYVVNSANNVYKCLFNNDSSPSTSEPVYLGNTAITTGDGYIWKYMYSISSFGADKFATANLIPIEANTDVITSAVPGSIEVIEIDDQGLNYTVYNTGTIQDVVSNTVFRIENSASSTNNIYTTSTIYIQTGTGAGSISEITNYISNTSGKFVTTENSLNLDTTSEYIISPTVNVEGDGSGVIAFSTVNMSTGKLTSISVQNTGSGYTFANVSIVSNTIHGSGAVASAIISPIKGHGSDPANELGAETLAITVDFTGTESNTIPLDISFRQSGIIRNPTEFSSNTIYANTTFNHTISFTPTYIGGQVFTEGELIRGVLSNNTAEVLFANTSLAIVYMTDTTSLQNGETVIGQTSGVNATILNLTSRDINKYSGNILYYSNFSPLTRSDINSETIKLIIKV